MSDHLPECPAADPDIIGGSYWCICDRLRACEQRVRDELPPNGADATWYLLGQRNGVQAARDAVAEWTDKRKSHDFRTCDDYDHDCYLVRDALAAIDALKDGNGNK